MRIAGPKLSSSVSSSGVVASPSAVTVTPFSWSSGNRVASPGGGGCRVEKSVWAASAEAGYLTPSLNVPVIASPAKLTSATLPASTCPMNVGS